MRKITIGCLATIGVFAVIIVGIALYQTLFDSGDINNKTQTQTLAETRTTGITTTQITEQYVMQLEIMAAQAIGLIDVDIKGCNSLDRIALNITSLTDEKLEVSVPSGMILEPQPEGVCCDVMVTQDEIITIVPHDSIGPLYINTASMNMSLDVPAVSDELVIGNSVTEDLEKLLELTEFYDQGFRVRQFAVWTITDNPGRNDYLNMNAFGWGGDINDAEINTIRNMFEMAGITVDDYRALRQAVYVELIEARNMGLVDIDATGSGSINRIRMSLASNTDDNLEVTILPGTIFTSSTAGVQSMVIIIEKLVLLSSYETTEPFNVDAACANMELDAPEEINSLVLSDVVAPPDLIKLLDLPDFQQETYRVQQFAIWTITDNPERDGYIGIVTDFGIFGTGPNDEEVQKITLLFEKAGILIGEYKALT